MKRCPAYEEIDVRPHVVVVGAGPVGCVAALLLARSDVTVTLVERNVGLTSASRASTFHPSTLDLLASLGIALHRHPDAVTANTIQWRNRRGAVLAEVSYRVVEGLTQHPFRVHLEQQSLLDLLAEAIGQERNIDLHSGTSVVGLDLGRRLVATESGGGRQNIAADLILGCDGAHSDVRRSAGIGFPVADYPTIALRARVQPDIASLLSADSAASLSSLCYFRGDDDGISALRMSDHTRLIVRGIGADDPFTRVSEAVVRATPLPIGELHIEEIDSYRLKRGVVDSYLSDDGGVMVIGDAAHVTSTAGGLNMNSGIHDAFTLMPIVAGWLHRGLDLNELRRATTRRREYVLREVIPRAERRVKGLQDRNGGALAAHLADIENLARDPAAARQFLIEASLLDAGLAAQ